MKRTSAMFATSLLIIFSLGTVWAAAPATAGPNVTVANTPANPVPVTGVQLPATKAFSIPDQPLGAFENHTFPGVSTTASLLTIVTHDPIEVTLNGPAPVLVATSSPLTLPLTQRIRVDSVNVACMLAAGSCFFRFFIVGD